MDFNEVLEKHKSNWKYEEVSFEDYYQGVESILNQVGFKPTAEQLDFLLEVDNITLVDSTAGAGKTTTSVVKSIIDEELWGVDPYSIIFLTFSKKSADDMKEKRSKIMQKVFEKKNFARMSTIHSLCYTLLKAFTEEAGLVFFDKKFIIQDEAYSLGDIAPSDLEVDDFDFDFDDYDDLMDMDLELGDSQSSGSGVTVVDIMKKFIEPNEELRYLDNFNEMKNIMSTLAFQKERMLNDDEIVEERIFQSMECTPEHYFQLRDDVEDYKKKMGYLDFTDMQRYTLNLLNNSSELYTNESFNKMFKATKLYIDEFQDMTPLQKELIKALREVKTEKQPEPTPLVCIGDGDQSIYTWRGADTLEFEKFQKQFDPTKENSQLKTFTINHRCGDKIIHKASKLININTLRNKKIIKENGRKGDIELKTYSSTKDQVKMVIRELNRIKEEGGEKELEEVAIIYREHSQALGLISALLREDFDFNLSGRKLPYNHWIYKNLMEMCESLVFAEEHTKVDKIYRFTPVSNRYTDIVKDKLKELKKKDIFSTWIDALEVLSKSDSPINITPKEISNLRLMREILLKTGEPVRPVIEKMYSLYMRHNLDYTIKNLIHVPRVEVESIEMFISSIPDHEDYDSHLEKVDKWIDQVRASNVMKYGVKLLSMHATKGLEFKYVFILGVDNNFTPKEKYARELQPRARHEYIEEERRLLYVGITRAIKQCFIFVSITEPSMFLTELDESYKQFISNTETKKGFSVDAKCYMKHQSNKVKEGIEWILEKYVS